MTPDPVAQALWELADAAEDVWDAYVLGAIDDDGTYKARLSEAMDAAWKEWWRITR